MTAPVIPPAEPVLDPTPAPVAPVAPPADGENVKGGLWQLVLDKFRHVTSEPGKPYAFKDYKRGDVVQLDDEQADRLVTLGAFAKPGQAEREEANRLKAAAIAAQAAAKDAQARLDAAQAAADAKGKA